MVNAASAPGSGPAAVSCRNSARTYAAYSAPLWRRVLLTRETAVIALTAAVIIYSIANVPNFDGPLTIKFLLQDIAPILLIALPMTLVIITGEIDLSVASIMGLSSVLLGVLILGAIVLDRLLANRQSRKLAEAREMTT